MTGEDEGDANASALDWDAFYETANVCLAPANELAREEPAAEVASSFLYACARFNAFAIQAQSEDPSAVSHDFVDFLVERFETELREHMEEAHSRSGPPATAGDPREVVELLRGLYDRSDEAFNEFMSMADRFINVANDMTNTHGVARASAALMHACARFNVFAMQDAGLKPEVVDHTLVGTYRDCYAGLLRVHLGDHLIKQNA